VRVSKSEQYRRFAEECLKMAAAVQDEQARAILTQMAQVWFRLSERDDTTSNFADRNDTAPNGQGC
jgi:hypothetical protein